MTVDTNEYFLHQVFRLLAISNRAIDEVQQAGLVPGHELGEGALFPTKEGSHDG